MDVDPPSPSPSFNMQASIHAPPRKKAKRKATATELQSVTIPFIKQFSGSTTQSAQTGNPLASLFNSITSAQAGYDVAMKALAHAATFTAVGEETNQVTDFIEQLKNFSETGRKCELKVLTAVITDFKDTLKVFKKTAAKTNKQPAPINVSTPLQEPIPPQVSSNKTLPTQQQSFVNSLRQNLPENNQWITPHPTIWREPKPKPQTSISKRQLILIKNADTLMCPLSTRELRNAINKTFAESNTATVPVVISIHTSKANNLVLTTTKDFDSAYLLLYKHIWEGVVPFDKALPVQPWYKVAIHGVPTSINLDEVIEEIQTYSNLTVVGNPHWLSSEINRNTKEAGSISVAFATPEEADKAIREPFYLFGLKLKVEKAHSTSPSHQCKLCQRFGHLDADCQHQRACRICGKEHATGQHFCQICNTKGKACKHLNPKCANCKGDHTADSPDCETLQAACKPRSSPISNNTHSSE